MFMSLFIHGQSIMAESKHIFFIMGKRLTNRIFTEMFWRRQPVLLQFLKLTLIIHTHFFLKVVICMIIIPMKLNRTLDRLTKCSQYETSLNSRMKWFLKGWFCLNMLTQRLVARKCGPEHISNLYIFGLKGKIARNVIWRHYLFVRLSQIISIQNRFNKKLFSEIIILQLYPMLYNVVSYVAYY